MKPVCPRFLLAGLAIASLALAQPQPRPQPPLMTCGMHGGVDIYCGTRSPEDLELTPDNKYLIVSQFVSGGAAKGAGLSLFDISKGTFSPISISAHQRKDWGDPACPGPVGDKLSPHGISLSKRANGTMQLYVVNHGGRESIEMYELKPARGSWDLVWHGCVVSAKDFNDVAAMPDGGFAATHPTSLRAKGDNSNLFSGQPSGWVVRWTAGKGEVELPGTRTGYPNGVLVASDNRTVYFNAWTAKEVHRYDLQTQKETGVVKLDFMPDNITWTQRHQVLAAGVKGVRGDCPPGSKEPCMQGFGVAEIAASRTGPLKAQTVFDSHGKGAMISGVSVALQAGNALYIGAFQGNRIVKIGSDAYQARLLPIGK
ncbi:MAG TPA: SMP-30/gluconolactonase/LRE family protein [Bryobacteraceae bacterium]|nr:SMP-30/gluconolactonase/LRE family protein [Bryobacteraceae bacterium]